MIKLPVLAWEKLNICYAVITDIARIFFNADFPQVFHSNMSRKNDSTLISDLSITVEVIEPLSKWRILEGVVTKIK